MIDEVIWKAALVGIVLDLVAVIAAARLAGRGRAPKHFVAFTVVMTGGAAAVAGWAWYAFQSFAQDLYRLAAADRAQALSSAISSSAWGVVTGVAVPLVLVIVTVALGRRRPPPLPPATQVSGAPPVLRSGP